MDKPKHKPTIASLLITMATVCVCIVLLKIYSIRPYSQDGWVREAVAAIAASAMVLASVLVVISVWLPIDRRQIGQAAIAFLVASVILAALYGYAWLVLWLGPMS